jgi:dolichol-phosphate mannosyltransferase
MNNDLLIFTPTYLEKDNIGPLLDQILSLNLPADILVIDDNSPDGTASLVKKYSFINNQIRLIKRNKKKGIGSAHKKGLNYAIANNYKYLITLDSDFSHKTIYLPQLLQKLKKENLDIVIGSRFISKNSLAKWNIIRKTITHFGHFLTEKILDLPYDSSGALRCYKLKNINKNIITNIKSDDYAFFYESLSLLHLKKMKISEISIDLPARLHGHSKMRLIDIFNGFIGLFILFFRLKKIKKKIY